ncbi:uncharacterized protein LOC121405130 [Drosophila obscura]|uniref:uncharacterized protein LOC121405130 n=1 Tax=Drosophila obscura TaxID=7282 RepID=UPI001BB15DB0|nr:uncharacterized protein LOC121405130 [Drosophila obscura]
MAPQTSSRSRSSRRSDRSRARGKTSFQCRVCPGVHPLRNCRKFIRLSVEKRLRAVLLHRHCSNCLAHEHSGKDCRSGDLCKVCSRNHHTLLHLPGSRRPTGSSSAPSTSPPSRRPAGSSSAPSTSPKSSRANPRPRLPVSRPVVGNPVPTANSLLQHQSINVLPTAMVVLAGTQVMSALIDPCTPVSCIDAEVARELKLPTTCIGDERVCTAMIRAKIGDFKVEAVFKIEPRLRVRTPIRQLSDTVRARFDDLRLANEQFHKPTTISLVLGADLYPRVIQPGFLARADGLPVAQSTVFGWIVSGACTQT